MLLLQLVAHQPALWIYLFLNQLITSSEYRTLCAAESAIKSECRATLN